MEHYKQQFKKGILELLILKLISSEKSYGYNLIVKIKHHSNGFFAIKEGTLYPLLYRMEEDGLVCSAEEIAVDSKRKKRNYSITESGQDMLNDLMDYWDGFSHCVNSILELGGQE